MALFQQLPSMLARRTTVTENYRGTKVEIQSVTKMGFTAALAIFI
jgi:hypothetical protein